MRISGNEPAICRNHLINILELIPKNYVFILETNGILIGNDPTYAEELSRCSNLYVRERLKKINPAFEDCGGGGNPLPCG